MYWHSKIIGWSSTCALTSIAVIVVYWYNSTPGYTNVTIPTDVLSWKYKAMYYYSRSVSSNTPALMDVLLQQYTWVYQ